MAITHQPCLTKISISVEEALNCQLFLFYFYSRTSKSIWRSCLYFGAGSILFHSVAARTWRNNSTLGKFQMICGAFVARDHTSKLPSILSAPGSWGGVEMYSLNFLPIYLFCGGLCPWDSGYLIPLAKAHTSMATSTPLSQSSRRPL